MATSENGVSEMNNDKLSGQLIIKAQLGDDIRKMMIHNEDLTLNELVLMMERVFAGKISNSDEITIKYLDDDGDKITLLNDSDLTVALHFHKCLRLFVLINGKEQVTMNSNEDFSKDENTNETKLFLVELKEIRSAVQTILDRLQSSKDKVLATTAATPTTATTTVTSAALPTTVVSSTACELDAYTNLQKQQRSVTPDTTQSHPNLGSNVQQQAVSTNDNQQVEIQNGSSAPPATFQQTPIPTPYFLPGGINSYQQMKPNAYGPPPSFPNMPPVPNVAASQYPPVSTPTTTVAPTFNASAPPSSMSQPSGFLGQQAAPPPQGGFYGQQQAPFQQRPPGTGYNPGDAYAQQQSAVPPSSNSSPATINPSYVQAPPMASQQLYGAYPPQSSYYAQMAQQYPKTS